MKSKEQFRSAVRDFIFGMTGYEFVMQAREMRGSLESVFMAITLGDLMGIPVVPPIFALRILPYVVPSIDGWKRRFARERELSDSEEFHLHGL
jgi:hypothetical protein